MFSWLRDRRRRKLLAEPFPPGWDDLLHRNVGHYPRLDPAEQAKLRDTTRVLVDEKSWEGCGGVEMTDEMRVTTAAQAALMLLGTDHNYFGTVTSILVYPTAFVVPEFDEAGDDYFKDSDTVAEGQAARDGVVILGWDQVLAEGRDPTGGHNVVIHEFAHQLDFLDRHTDGTPPLATEALTRRWQAVLKAALEDHRAALKRQEETFFSEQAGDDEAEFFADASESFFCLPHDLEAELPELFTLFREYYRLDPRKWFR